MKIVEKISLVLFSSIMLILSILTCLLIFGWAEFETINIFVRELVEGDVSSKMLLCISILFMLLAIKSIFFSSSSSDDSTAGVLLENEDGKLLISKDTIENLVNSVANGFESTENVSTKVILDKENNVSIEATLYVMPNTVIKELSANLQSRIKEVIKKTTDLDVKEINIKIKNVANKPETKEM